MMTVVIAVSLSSLSLAQQKPRSSSTAGPAGRANTSTTRRISRPVAETTPSIEKDFEEALRVIERQYVEGSRLDYNSVFKSSILGMLRSLDPHSNYYDREEYEELKTDQRSEYFGIGASIQSYFFGDDADTFITATFQNSPAARAGLRFGDRIVAVDGIKMNGKPSLEVRDKIRGPRGSVVKVTIQHAADNRLQTVEITRDVVPQPSIPDAYMIKPGVGYIDMTRGFNYSTTEELQDALDQLHARGMNSLVLDLRNNPGGFLDQAIHVAEVFLPNGQLILTQKGRNGLRDNTYKSANNSPDSVPLVILINENTASASEIVAGAMQDHDRALIVGETSFGKGLVQSIIPLDYGAGLTLTSAKYYTPSGRLIQRDYADGGLYDYYTHGGSKRAEDSAAAKIMGAEKKTDSGRPVYGGGGIAPDEKVGPRTVTIAQRRLSSAIFAFARELANGRIPAPANYRVRGAINFEHELKPNDFVVTESIVRSFKDFVASDPDFKNFAPLVDRNRAFLEVQLRFNLAQAAYGRVMAERVFVTTDDKQLARAVDVLPRARDLAMTATHHTQP
jgi:carboxyl-terminal processing protease